MNRIKHIHSCFVVFCGTLPPLKRQHVPITYGQLEESVRRLTVTRRKTDICEDDV